MSKTICRGPKCDRPATAKGCCAAHRDQEKRGLPLQPVVERSWSEVDYARLGPQGVCRGPKCTRPAVAKGLCAAHRGQELRGRPFKPLIERRTFKPHIGNTLKSGYRTVFKPGHPNANLFGNVFEHIMVMADSLPSGKVPDGVTVHHKNTDRSDNRLENLQMRIGQHGRGGAMQCIDCGSDRVIPVGLPEDNNTD